VFYFDNRSIAGVVVVNVKVVGLATAPKKGVGGVFSKNTKFGQNTELDPTP
jgi:hypothetical protein